MSLKGRERKYKSVIQRCCQVALGQFSLCVPTLCSQVRAEQLPLTSWEYLPASGPSLSPSLVMIL